MSSSKFKDLKSHFDNARKQGCFKEHEIVKSNSFVAIANIGKDGTIYNKTIYMSIKSMFLYIDGYMDGFSDANIE